ncbi:serine/threonine-protein phosphatase 6 regulatory ankyrin repeat subunit B-like [Magallana gigas]|uniref:serine/threonine-protein phosphatase 6 regulatory ankyrin repeat subunit B-like n=1 Tax=Magallana gigas TaxID=29159 RepID=UPI00333E6A86
MFRNSFKDKYCALVLLVLFNNDLCVEDIQESSISTEKYEHALKLCEMQKNTTPHTIDDAFETLQGFFVKKIIDNYHFYHDFVMEVTTYVFGKKCPLQIIEYADISFLRKRVTLKCFNDTTDQFTISLSDKYIDALGKRLFNDMFGERLLDVVLNPCLNNEKVMRIFINELKHHPEKLKLLLEKQKLQIDTQEINQTSNYFFLSKLVFVSLEERISPLSAIIIFCDTRLSLNCLKILQQMPEYFVGNSLLSSICCNGSKDVYSMFIKDHIRESQAEKWKHLFPIHIASAFHNNDILRELLENGADVNLKTTDENQLTPLTIATGNKTEEKEENDNENSSHSSRSCTVEVLLSHGADINLCMENGASPLYIACQEGHNNIVDLLVSNGADINLCTKNGASPLLIACEEEHDDIVQNLLSKGANINTSMEDGTSPLFKACHEGHENTVRILLHNGADVNICIIDGSSPLFIACQEGHEIIVELLQKKGADINFCKENGASPLYVACEKEHENIVQFLNKNEAEVNLCLKDGTSPLCISCQKNHGVIVEILMQRGADINLCSENGASPLHT